MEYLKSRIDLQKSEIDQLNSKVEDLQSEIEELNSPKAEDEVPLSGDEGMASEISEEPEVSPSYEDSSFQTIVVPEKPVAMPPKNVDAVAVLEAKIASLRKELNLKDSELEGNTDYIKRTEDQAAEFKKQHEDEKKTTADLKAQLDKANLTIKAREDDINGENGFDQQLADANATIDELQPQLAQQIQFNKNLKEELERAKLQVEHYKNEAAAAAQTSSDLIQKVKQIEKQVENRDVRIEQLIEQMVEGAHFETDLYEDQQVLEDVVVESNKSVDDGPRFNPHPETHIAPETITPASQALSDQIFGLLPTSGESSSFEEPDWDDASEDSADFGNPANANEGIESEHEEIAEDQRILEQRRRQVDIIEIKVKVPVEEVIIRPAGPGPMPATVPSIRTAPEIIIKEVDRVVYNGKDVHSWLYIERNFLILVLAFFNYLTGILWPSFIQEIRGMAPTSNHPILVLGLEDNEEDENGDLPGFGSIPLAMVNSPIASSTPGPSGPMNSAALGSDPIDTQVGSGTIETADFATLLPPLDARPDRRESIAFAPPASRPTSSSNNANPGLSSTNPFASTGDGKGVQFGPPSPPSGNIHDLSPSSPSGDEISDLQAANPGFWNISAPRPLPSIKWTLWGMLFHLIVYYSIFITIDTYFERNRWFAANDSTRQLLNSRMGARYANGILRKIVSENWAHRIEKSLVYAITKASIMEIKPFRMPG
ncbi:hypothetical protein ONS95_004239 [Cadophora gregata]|uniref:uncharacterized protein n=1 Tax=Cadophora gregata TaxID=51156 RepID=UPI0026DC5C69|nr:uncharacterized protein ONS95_004239 [Cadophora gregata]KAK0105386.1 hypothetical protein ONS96_004778 [Cadophora gregata f. sp. sojae]KAK0105717.1 hypothetical protein ONS95_004239 [Cadophora gregata]